MLDRPRCLVPAESALDPPTSVLGWLLVAAILLGCLMVIGCAGQRPTTIQPDAANVDLLIKDIANRTWE